MKVSAWSRLLPPTAAFERHCSPGRLPYSFCFCKHFLVIVFIVLRVQLATRIVHKSQLAAAAAAAAAIFVCLLLLAFCCCCRCRRLSDSLLPPHSPLAHAS
jgi:hypothetical protein